MSVGYQYEDCHCHPWCSDPARDEAVRASEDGRSGPLPTLEDCIWMIPKIGSASSAPEHENKGERMGTKSEIQAADYRAEAAERITQALTADRFAAAVVAADTLKARVAELESERDNRATIDEVAHQRDMLQARVNRLEEGKLHFIKASTFNFNQWKKAAARVTELEGETKGLRGDVRAAETEADSLRGQLESVADRAAAAETALEASGWRMLALGEIVTDGDQFLRTDGIWQATSLRQVIRDRNRFRRRVSAPAAIDAAGTDVVAWGVMSSDEPPHRVSLHWDQESADRWGRKQQSQYTTKLVVVPLYAAPQPAPGWLTEEGR